MKQKQKQELQKSIDYLLYSGFHVQDVAPDGNCFFSAVAMQLVTLGIGNANNQQFYTPQELREIAVGYLINNRYEQYTQEEWLGLIDAAHENEEGHLTNAYVEHIGNHGDPYGDFYTGLIIFYLEYLGRDGVHADNLIMQALVNVFNLNINIIDINGGNPPAITPNDEGDTIPISVLYTGDHYMSVTKSLANHGVFIPYIPFVGAASSSDNLTLSDLPLTLDVSKAGQVSSSSGDQKGEKQTSDDLSLNDLAISLLGNQDNNGYLQILAPSQIWQASPVPINNNQTAGQNISWNIAPSANWNGLLNSLSSDNSAANQAPEASVNNLLLEYIGSFGGHGL